jgi:hypothetical protein
MDLLLTICVAMSAISLMFSIFHGYRIKSMRDYQDQSFFVFEREYKSNRYQMDRIYKVLGKMERRHNGKSNSEGPGSGDNKQPSDL